MAKKQARIEASKPTILPIEEVSSLPSVGQENIDYRVAMEDGGYQDYVWNGDRFCALPFDTETVNYFFGSILEKLNDIEERLEELEGKSRVLFEGSNIELTEMGATIGKRFNISTDIVVTNGTVFHVTLKDMTVDGEPIDDIYGDITAYQVPSWDWQGGDLYSEAFGNGAYFAFGTEPKDAVATTATLGFVNESDGFEVRTLVIGNVKVEVDRIWLT